MESQKGLRMTRQRRVILEELRKVTSHPTADQIYAMVRCRLPRISLGTVYRNLDILSEQGEILRLDCGGSQRRFDGTVTEHFHVRCVECGKVDDLPSSPTLTFDRAFREATDYQLLGHRLDFFGRCPDCQGSCRPS